MLRGLVCGVPVSRVVVRAVGGDLDDVFFLGREWDAELRVDLEGAGCRGVAEDRGSVVVSVSGRVEDGPGSRIDVVVHLRDVVNSAVCGRRNEQVELLAGSMGSYGETVGWIGWRRQRTVVAKE